MTKIQWTCHKDIRVISPAAYFVWLNVKVRPQKVDVAVEVESTTCALTALLPDLTQQHQNRNTDIHRQNTG